MKIVIFGASGRTGQLVASGALEAGHTVTAFVRSPRKLLIKHPKLKLVTGDAHDVKAVRRAVTNQDAVIVTLGYKTMDAWFKPKTELSEALAAIAHGMEAANVKRLVLLSSFATSKQIWWPEKLLLHTLGANIFADTARQETVVMKSRLDWTIIRAARLTDGPPTANWRADPAHTIGPFSRVSRADVATCILWCLDAPGTVRQSLIAWS